MTFREVRQSVRGITLIKAPSNLGLRPPAPGQEPGTWRAPEALADAGLDDGLRPASVVALPRPPYDFEPQPGTRLRNGLTLRAFNEALADAVEEALGEERFPVVVGGDCGVLLGALAGARRRGELTLAHIDGHSDFRHPGNYDPAATISAVAGMDLALATGRGESIMTDWDGRTGPLVPDARVVQIGERESHDPDWAWPDVRQTEITQLDIFWVQEHGIPATVERAFQVLDRTPDLPFWLHFDVDMLDQTVMPAVDSPGSPGLGFAAGAALLRGVLSSPRCLGVDVTIFDPDLDAGGVYAHQIVRMLLDGIGPALTAPEQTASPPGQLEVVRPTCRTAMIW
jgi:arginase